MEIDLYYLGSIVLLGIVIAFPLFLAGVLLGWYFWKDHGRRWERTRVERQGLRRKYERARSKNRDLKQQVDAAGESTEETLN